MHHIGTRQNRDEPVAPEKIRLNLTDENSGNIVEVMDIDPPCAFIDPGDLLSVSVDPSRVWETSRRVGPAPGCAMRVLVHRKP